MRKILLILITLLSISIYAFAQQTPQSQYKQEFIKATIDTVVLLITDEKGNTVGGKVFTLADLINLLNSSLIWFSS